MFRTLIATALLAGGLIAGPAQAQTYYRGYDIGPDYGGMVEELRRRDAALAQQIRQREIAITRAAMQDPVCQDAYQQFEARGGRMSYPAFAYLCAATGRFTPDGIARFQQNESANRQNELRAVLALRDAERRRGVAQTGLIAGGHHIQRERGELLRGRSTYIGPDGRPVALQHTQPGLVTADPQTGRRYVMDTHGRYFLITPHGQLVPMQPAYGG